MDKEKLTKAIVEYCEDFANGIYKPSVFDISDAFKQGADWLMQQPISERMADAEMAKARAAYNRAEEGYNSKDDIEYAVGHVVKTVLEGIFGADLFR